MSLPKPDSPLVRHRTLLLVALAFLTFVPFLGWRDMWYPDEPDVGEVGRAMYLSGDWIAPRRNGEIWVDYPPMVYWVGTISSHLLGGVSELSLRLPITLIAIALIVLTCTFASRWLGPKGGLWAGFLLLTFQHFGYEAICYRPDLPFSLAIAAGLFTYAAGAGERPRRSLRAAGFALLGLAMLSKGPLGLLFPGLVLTLWHGSRREWRLLAELPLLALLTLAVALPWYVACAKAMGADNILHELYAQNVQRFYSGDRGHGKPPLYYLANLWTDLAPWSLLLPLVLVWLYRSGRWRDRHVQLCLWWSGTLLAFLSVAVTKRQVYLLPAYPAVAVLLAAWIADLGSERAGAQAPNPRPARAVALAWAVVFALVGTVALAPVLAFEPILARLELDTTQTEVARNLRLPLVALGGVLLLGGIWIASAWRQRDPVRALARLGAVQLPLWVVIGALVFPALDPARTWRPAGEWIRARVGSQPRFGLADPVYGVRKMGAFTFYSGVLAEHLHDEAQIDRWLADHPDSIVLVNERTLGDVLRTPRKAWPWPVLTRLEPAGYSYLVLGSPGSPGTSSAER